MFYSVDKLRHCSGCLCSRCCSVSKHVHKQVWKTCAEMCEPYSCRRHLFSCIIHQSYIRFIVTVKLSIQEAAQHKSYVQLLDCPPTIRVLNLLTVVLVVWLELGEWAVACQHPQLCSSQNTETWRLSASCCAQCSGLSYSLLVCFKVITYGAVPPKKS